MSPEVWLFAGLAVLAAGCPDQVGPLPALPPPPSVILTVDAEPAVRRVTHTLRLSVASLPGLPVVGEPVEAEPGNAAQLAPEFPERLVLPENITAADAAFWVEVAALDAEGRTLTSARLITNVLAGQTLRPVLLLSERCLDLICGAKSSTCSPEGLCRSAVRAAEDLPSEPWP